LKLLHYIAQALIDETSRARYDKQGKAGFAETETMDGAAFFTMVFGSEKFENLVGEMKVCACILFNCP
jgi:DnaJ-class molecular chaperone